MMNMSLLEILPTEILCLIIDIHNPWDIKELSCVNKRLREACLPTLFRSVKIRFSDAGFDGLKRLIKSHARYHVISITYEVPELLNAEILDFDRFKADILTPDSYVETAKEMYDAGFEADECAPYMAIYETVNSICEEQRSIVDSGVDISILSSTFAALPRLTEVCLSFVKMLYGADKILSIFGSDMTVPEDSYAYHVQVISDAIQNAQSKDISIHTITLENFNLPYYCTCETPDLSSVTESLRKLLESIQVLRLIRSKSPLELLSRCVLDLHRLDLCNLVTEYTTLEKFLDTNKRSICSVGFCDVRTSGLGRTERNVSELSSSMLCRMLKVPHSSTSCGADYCEYLPFKKKEGGCYRIITFGGQEREDMGRAHRLTAYPDSRGVVNEKQ